MFKFEVQPQVFCAAGPVRAMGAHVGLFPSVDHEVSMQVRVAIGAAESFLAELALVTSVERSRPRGGRRRSALQDIVIRGLEGGHQR